MTPDPHSIRDADEVLRIEREFVQPADGGRGLAFSGGGIRSAAFSLGVSQALVVADRLKEFDYLSTVSGGGYFGTSLTFWLHQGLPSCAGDEAQAGTSPTDFPFGARTSGDPKTRAQNALLNFIRQNATYLTPTTSLGLISALAVVLRGAYVSLLVHGMLLTGFMGIAIVSGAFNQVPARLLSEIGLGGLQIRYPLALALLVLVASGFVAVCVSLASRLVSDSRSYAARTRFQKFLGRVWKVILGFTVVGFFPAAHQLVLNSLTEAGDGAALGGVISLGSGVLVSGLGAVLGVSSIGKAPELKGEEGLFSGARLLGITALLLGGFCLGAYALAELLVLGLQPAAPHCGFHPGVLLFPFFVLVGLWLGWMSNINYLGPHRMYRDRLMELFLANRDTVRRGSWGMATEADTIGIHQVCGASSGRVKKPYHLINTNVVLVDSSRPIYRGRGGDAFLLSPLFCGSQATGWIPSREYMGARRNRGMSLPSAMAISGAALNPNSGPSGRGATRGRLMSALLGLLNLRLGYFAPNPGSAQSRVPNMLSPGLFSSFLGEGQHEEARIVELTDGGHFENLALYELVRRGCKSIVVVDGGQDEKFQFSDLANAVERCRVDHGAKIEFLGECGLDGLLPGSGPVQPSEFEKRFQLARRAFAIGTIRYPGDSSKAPSGRLVYIKTTLFPGLPADVMGYKLECPAFPDESTGDQFFDERQFEAYRELGYHAGWNFLEHDQASTDTPAHQAAACGGSTASDGSGT